MRNSPFLSSACAVLKNRARNGRRMDRRVDTRRSRGFGGDNFVKQFAHHVQHGRCNRRRNIQPAQGPKPQHFATVSNSSLRNRVAWLEMPAIPNTGGLLAALWKSQCNQLCISQYQEGSVRLTGSCSAGVLTTCEVVSVPAKLLFCRRYRWNFGEPSTTIRARIRVVVSERLEPRSTRPGEVIECWGVQPAPVAEVEMKSTDISDPNYFHKVVDCQWACPAHTPVPEYIPHDRGGAALADAYMVNWKSNVFPGILGRTCDRPCEPVAGEKGSRPSRSPSPLEAGSGRLSRPISEPPTRPARNQERQAHRTRRMWARFADRRARSGTARLSLRRVGLGCEAGRDDP